MRRTLLFAAVAALLLAIPLTAGAAKRAAKQQTYPDPDLTPDYTATCEGNEDFNGFYGEGIVDAYAASKKR